MEFGGFFLMSRGGCISLIRGSPVGSGTEDYDGDGPRQDAERRAKQQSHAEPVVERSLRVV